MIYFKENIKMQKFAVTLNELADENYQLIRWLFVFKLRQALNDSNSYVYEVILDDLNLGQNNRFNLFEIDTEIFDIDGEYTYEAYQLDNNDKKVKLVEIGRMYKDSSNIYNENNIATKTVVYES